MDLELAPGSYVLAVSGGVDSMTLLHILKNKPDIRLTVAHFDHGIRSESVQDRQLVEQVARQHSLPFVYAEGHLGPGASEAEARQARYQFLHQVLLASGARAIITAHHQDDVLETAILNLLRGTDRKGLSALGDRNLVIRPLLRVPKTNLINYASDQGLVWHEDSTNQNTAYLRNYIRHNILPRFTSEQREQLWQLIVQSRQISQQLDNLLANQLHLQSQSGRLDRTWFNHLPHVVAREVMATWLRAHSLYQFDRRALERLVVNAKTSPSGKLLDVLNGWSLQIGQYDLALRPPER